MADTPLDKLKRMTAWEAKPRLSQDELESLLERFAVADSDGYAPTDEEWVPTYMLRSAAREGWVMKMGKASELISSDLDGDRMSADQIFRNCERMVRKYSGTSSPTIGTSTSEASDTDTGSFS